MVGQCVKRRGEKRTRYVAGFLACDEERCNYLSVRAAAAGWADLYGPVAPAVINLFPG